MKRIFPEREDFLSIWPHSLLSLLLLLSPSETLKKSQAFNRHSWEHMSYLAYGAVVTETIGPCPPETCSVVAAKINQGDHDSVFQVKWCAKLLNFCPLLFLIWSPTFMLPNTPGLLLTRSPVLPVREELWSQTAMVTTTLALHLLAI